MLEYDDYVERLQATHPELAGEIRQFRSLERVLPWLEKRGHDLATLDMVTQDEYCHDLLVPLGRSNEWLSFGMT